MNKPDLQVMLGELQRDLRLQDWRINIEYVRNLTNRAGYPVHGLCSHLVDAKVATIQIRDPETPATSSDPSVEETIVHELVHLHFAPFSGASSAEIAAEEQAVWALTEALHGAKTAARRGQIARAMMARATAGTATGLVDRSRKMDMTMLLAALKAALQADDPKAAIEALLKEIDGGAPMAEPAEEPAPDSMQMGAADEEIPPPKQQAPADLPEDAKAQRARLARGVTRQEFDRLQVEQIVHQHGSKLTDKQRAFALSLSPSQVRAYVATQTSGGDAPKSSAIAAERSQASGIVSRAEFERFRVDQLIHQHGAHLSDSQRKFAAGLQFDQVRAYLAQHATSAQPVQRNQAPSKGGAGVDDREARRERLGLSMASPVQRVGNVQQLGSMTREQAIAHRAQKGAAR